MKQGALRRPVIDQFMNDGSTAPGSEQRREVLSVHDAVTVDVGVVAATRRELEDATGIERGEVDLVIDLFDACGHPEVVEQGFRGAWA